MSLKFPELLALGCCLAAGDCMEDVKAKDGEAAVSSAQQLSAEFLTLSAQHPHVSKMPAVSLLAANAYACSPPGKRHRCGKAEEEVQV